MVNLGPAPSAAAIAAAIAAALAGTTIATTSAVQGGNIEIFSGDDYLEADARALRFMFIGPNLTGSSIAMAFEAVVDGSKPLTVAGTIFSGTEAHFELTAAQTSGLFIGSCAYEYTIVATLSDGSVVTLQRGHVTVRE